MVLPPALLACLVALWSQDQPPPQSRPSEARPAVAAQAETTVVGPDVISLDRISRALKRGDAGDAGFFPVGLPPMPPLPPVVPIKTDPVANYRVEIFGPRMLTFEEDLKAYLSIPAGSVNPGFFDMQPPGWHRAGAGPAPMAGGGGGSVGVDPLAPVRFLQKWAHRSAVSRARQQVEEELQALLAAQRTAEKPDKAPH